MMKYFLTIIAALIATPCLAGDAIARSQSLAIYAHLLSESLSRTSPTLEGEVDPSGAIPAAAGFDSSPAAAVFHNDFAAAEAESLRIDRPLLLHFWFEGCRYCPMLDALQEPVGTQLILKRNYIVCRIDMRHDPYGTARQMGVRIAPTEIVRYQGAERYRWERFQGETVKMYATKLADAARRLRSTVPQ